jgi:CDP-diacylglycerol--serine O-phosphatidyltransferase
MVTPAYMLAVAWLMASRLPVFAGKRIGDRVAPEMVGPSIIVMVVFFALLIAYPWVILTAGTLAYLASLPFGCLSYQAYERRSREGRVEAAPASATHAPPVAASVVPSQWKNFKSAR